MKPIYSFCPNLIISTRNIVIKFRFRLCIRDWRSEISLPTAGVQFVSWGTAGGGSDTTCFLYQTVHSSFLNCWLRYLNLYWIDTRYFWTFVEFWTFVDFRSGSSVIIIGQRIMMIRNLCITDTESRMQVTICNYGKSAGFLPY